MQKFGHSHCLEGISFVSSEGSYFYKIESWTITVSDFIWFILTTLSGDEKLLPRYVNRSPNFRYLPLKVEMTIPA